MGTGGRGYIQRKGEGPGPQRLESPRGEDCQIIITSRIKNSNIWVIFGHVTGKSEMWNAAVSLKEPLVFPLLLKVPKGNRTPRPPRGRDGEGRVSGPPGTRQECGWGGVGGRGKLASPSRQGSRKADGGRPVKTCEDPLPHKGVQDCNLPSVCSSFKQRHSEALGGPTLGCRSPDAIGQSSTLLRGGRADLATL